MDPNAKRHGQDEAFQLSSGTDCENTARDRLVVCLHRFQLRLFVDVVYGMILHRARKCLEIAGDWLLLASATYHQQQRST